MSSQKTTNMNLHKWVLSDPVKMAEFNENFQKIDAAIAAGAKIATGSYVGTGTYGSSHPCSLTFDFVPQLLMLFEAGGIRYYITTTSSTSHRDYIFVLDGVGEEYTTIFSDGSYPNTYAVSMKKSADGKTIYFTGNNDYQQCNKKGVTYRYLVIG